MTQSEMEEGWGDPPPLGHQLQVEEGGVGVKDEEGILQEEGVGAVG